MRSNAIPVILAGIVILLFSLALIFAGFVAFVVDIAPQIVQLQQPLSNIPIVLVLAGLSVALVGVVVGLNGLVSTARRT